VEHYGDHVDKWYPTVGCGLNRDDGRHQLSIWRAKNPDDRFRLTRYEAVKVLHRGGRR
jgi:hypothetical protein